MSDLPPYELSSSEPSSPVPPPDLSPSAPALRPLPASPAPVLAQRPASFLKLLGAAMLGTALVLGGLLVFGLLLVSAIASAAGGAPSVPKKAVVVLDLSGALPELAPAPNPLLGEAKALDLADVRRALSMAAADARVEAVWVRTDGLSAAWATREEIRNGLLAVRAAGKTVYASTRDAGTDEAAYYVLSAADSVFLPPLAAFEFNGFVLQPEFYARALAKLGVTPNVVRAGTFKAAVEPFLREDLSDANRAQLRGLLDAQNRAFIAAVAESRAMTTDRVNALLTQRPVLTTEDAVRERLADAIEDETTLEARLSDRFADGGDLATISARDYAATSPSAAGIKSGTAGQVAVVVAAGTIVDGESGTSFNPLFGGETVGDRTFVDAMEAARTDDKVKAVVLRVNSPGGSVSASEAMRRAVARTAEDKPVVVSMGDYAASGGYWISTPAALLVAEPTTLTGSIGVFSLWFNTRGLFEDKLGITLDTVRTSPFANLVSATASPSDAERALLQRYVDTTYARFLGIVAESRGMATAQVDSLAQGRVWSGADAQRIGLVDSLGGLGLAVRLAARKAGLAEGTYGTRMLPRPKPWFTQMQEQMGARAAAWTLARRSPQEQALARAADALAALDAWQGRALAWLPPSLRMR